MNSATEKTNITIEWQQLRPAMVVVLLSFPAKGISFTFIKRSAAMISLKGPIRSPIIHCSFQCGPGLQDLRVCEFVLHNSYWTRLDDVDYSLNILLHLPERASSKKMKT